MTSIFSTLSLPSLLLPWRELLYCEPHYGEASTTRNQGRTLANIQQGTESLSVERSRLQGTKGKRLWSTSSKDLRLSIQRWQVSPSTNGMLPKYTWWGWNWSHSQLSLLDDHSFSWHLNCSLWEIQSQKTQPSFLRFPNHRNCEIMPQAARFWDNLLQSKT